ncbi:MAG: 50S ribosomal protein L32 [candidate division Zixibacteria bacterium]|nr:50S ribosomal protein L32 [candidate division Zixibacteria bacterium]
MSLPKRRHSHTRGAKRRTHWKLNKPNLTNCPNCSQKKLSHHVCPHCGHYDGRRVILESKLKS